MSAASEKLKKDRQNLINAFTDATRSTRPVAGLAASASLLVALIGTMLPLQAVNLFFSMTCVVICIALFALRQYVRLPRKHILAIALVVTVSLTTGCSATWLADLDNEILQACQASTGEECRTGQAIGYAVFGIPIRHATLGQAQLDGGLQRVFGVENVKSYGLVTVTRLTVYGS